MDLSVKYAHYNEDPQGQRTGDAPAPELAAVIRKQCAEASAAVDANQVDAKVPMTAELIAGQIDLLRGAVTIAYPMGLPDYDRVSACLDDDEDLSGSASGKEVYLRVGACDDEGCAACGDAAAAQEVGHVALELLLVLTSGAADRLAGGVLGAAAPSGGPV